MLHILNSTGNTPPIGHHSQTPGTVLIKMKEENTKTEAVAQKVNIFRAGCCQSSYIAPYQLEIQFSLSRAEYMHFPHLL